MSSLLNDVIREYYFRKSSTLIAGRQILEVALVTNEVVDDARVNKMPIWFLH